MSLGPIDLDKHDHCDGWHHGYREGHEEGLKLGLTRPVPMILTCPACNARHIDEGEFSTKPHHTHACQSCGMCWRPAVVHTYGVQFLPGFKNVPPGVSEAAP